MPILNSPGVHPMNNVSQHISIAIAKLTAKTKFWKRIWLWKKNECTQPLNTASAPHRTISRQSGTTSNKIKLQSTKEDKIHIKWKVKPTPPQRNYGPELKYRRKFFKYRPHYLTNPTTISAKSVLTSRTREKSIQRSLLGAAFEK